MKKNNETKKAILKLYLTRKYTQTQLAERFAITQKTVTRWIKEAGYPARSLKREPVKQYYKMGFSVAEICEFMKTTNQTVRRFLNEPDIIELYKKREKEFLNDPLEDYKGNVKLLQTLLKAAIQKSNTIEINRLSDSIVKLEKANYYQKQPINHIKTVST